MSLDYSALDRVDLPLLGVDAQGLVRYANPAFGAASGRAADGVAYAAAGVVLGLGPDDERRLAEALAAGKPSISLELHAMTAEGRPWPIRVGGRAHAEGWVLTLSPLDERRALRDEVGRLRDKLDLACELGHLGTWERDVRTGLGEWSDAMWRMWGLPPQPASLPRDEYLRWIDPADRDALLVLNEESLRRPGRYGMRYRLRRPDGRQLRVHARWDVRTDADGRALQVQGIVRDDTEVFELARRADEAQAQLRLATELAQIAVWRRERETGVVHLDARGWAILGLQPRDEPLPASAWDDLVHPEDLAEFVRHVSRAASAPGVAPWDVTVRLRDATGGWRHVLIRSVLQRNESGQVVGTTGVALDLTEHFRTIQRGVDLAQRLQLAGEVAEPAPDAAAFRQLQLPLTPEVPPPYTVSGIGTFVHPDERAALVVHGAGIGTWESAPDARLGWWDAQMFRLRGREPRGEPVTIDEMLEWVHPEDRQALLERQSAVPAPQYPQSLEFRVVWPDGSVRWIASRSAVIVDGQGHPVRRVGINWDVTEARHAAAAQQERVVAQREAQAKSRFLARMSHELRTPLNAVLGFTQLLLSEPDADRAVRRDRVEHMRAAGEHLLLLVDDVLDLSSLESGDVALKLQPVAAATLVRTTLPMVAAQAQAAGVRLQADDLDGVALADPLRLREALLQLLTNAVKYNRRGGTVRLESALHGNRLRLAVIDTGLGMSPAQLAHLFEPFNRLGRERDGVIGTGIGLAIARASVQRMGGSIAVDSRAGEGSRFEIDLPRAVASEQPAPPPARSADAAPACTRGAVLYIEDNPVNVLLLSEMLRRRPDLGLHTAATGEEGLRLAQQHRPPLALIDLHLPDIDGLEVLRRLREDDRTAALHCVAVSANAMPEDIRAARAAGFDDYWTKPLDLAVISAALRERFGPPPV